MKIVFVAVVSLFWSVFASTSTIGPLLGVDFPDTEVSTNVTFTIDYEQQSAVRIKLDCDASATNNLEVLIGHDDNADGNLSIEESDFAFGYDCGVWFERVTDPSSMQAVAGPTAGMVSKELRLKCRNVPICWNLVRITRRGRIVDNESVKLSFDRKKFVVIFR